eukprot:SAG11_NODE_2276_length_3583_cov_2.156429_2_plen_96_part_00
MLSRTNADSEGAVGLKRAVLPISEYMTGDDMIEFGADLQSREVYSQMEWKMKEHWFRKLDQLWGGAHDCGNYLNLNSKTCSNLKQGTCLRFKVQV